MIAFIDDHRGVHGVEPICEVLPIAPSTYHAHAAQRIDPAKRSAREVKRRADVVGIFPNDETIIRMVGAQMLEINDEWAVARRYMSLEGLARVMHIENVRLPAVVA